MKAQGPFRLIFRNQSGKTKLTRSTGEEKEMLALALNLQRGYPMRQYDVVLNEGRFKR
jgi:hypothetical protein